MNENLKKIQHFFMVDQKIKEEMFNSCPPSDNDFQDENSMIKYCDDLYKTIKYIICELNCISCDYIKRDEISKKLDDLKKNMINDFMLCGTDINKLRIFYKKYISNMEPEFINSVKLECVGYSLKTPNKSVKLAQSINEILHLFHSYIINNESIYESINFLSSKENNYKYSIKLYGTDDALAKVIFENFPANLNCGWVDMVSISEDKLIMMVRDRGHALTMEITKSGKKIRIEYFVPKLCNINMINNLPGINKIKLGAPGATGVFETENLSDLFTFISMVPMDSDMFIDDLSEVEQYGPKR